MKCPGSCQSDLHVMRHDGGYAEYLLVPHQRYLGGTAKLTALSNWQPEVSYCGC